MGVHDWTLVPAGISHDFHHEWISTIKRALNSGLLPANYYALAEQIAGGLGPDVLALESGAPEFGASFDEAALPPNDVSEMNGGVAVAEPKVQFASIGDIDSSRRKHIVIRHVSGHAPVAVIEIVSPGNKSTRDAVDRFVGKAWELLESGIHLMAIDLFPPTTNAPRGLHNAIWGEYSSQSFEPPLESPVVVSSFAATTPKKAFANAIAIGERLPEMPLFLRHEHFVNVPLATTYDTAWEATPKVWRDRLTASASSRVK